MFEKNSSLEKYTRDEFTFEEKLFSKYLELRKVMHDLEKYKYGTNDEYQHSEDFKQGFLAGVKIISSLILDI